jgi:type IV pilus assembly protein PilZ
MSRRAVRRQERRFRRKAVRVLVDFLGGAGVRCEYATILGPGGMFIETEEPIEIGSPIRVRFRLPESDQLHEIGGRVAWNQPATSGEAATRAPGMGIEFVDAAATAALARDLDGMR